MGPEGIFLENSPITTFQQSLTHSAMHTQKWALKILHNITDLILELEIFVLLFAVSMRISHATDSG